MLMCRLGVLVRFLTVLVSAGGMLLRRFVFAVLMMVRRFTMVVGRGFMFTRGKVMMLAGFVLSLGWHRVFLLKNEIPDVADKSARLVFRHEPHAPGQPVLACTLRRGGLQKNRRGRTP
jgi:hypothetical protein